MNRRKGKGNASAKANSAKATPAPKPSTPVPPVVSEPPPKAPSPPPTIQKPPTPPPVVPYTTPSPPPRVQSPPTPPPPARIPTPARAPPPTQSQLLRREWKTFEVFLAQKRQEKDVRLAEMRSAAGPTRTARGLSAPKSPGLIAAENKLNREYAEFARKEWERRLKARDLNEEDWEDITPEEMRAVEAAFFPPDITSDDNHHSDAGKKPTASSAPNGSSSASMQSTSSSSSFTSPGGWNVHPSVLPSQTPNLSNGFRQEQKPSPPLRTQSPLVCIPSLFFSYFFPLSITDVSFLDIVLMGESFQGHPTCPY